MLAPSITTLLQEARAGSGDALNRLLEQCGPRLLSLIRLRMGSGLRSRMESGDLLNATLLRAFRAFPRLGPDTNHRARDRPGFGGAGLYDPSPRGRIRSHDLSLHHADSL